MVGGGGTILEWKSRWGEYEVWRRDRQYVVIKNLAGLSAMVTSPLGAPWRKAS